MLCSSLKPSINALLLDGSDSLLLVAALDALSFDALPADALLLLCLVLLLLCLVPPIATLLSDILLIRVLGPMTAGVHVEGSPRRRVAVPGMPGQNMALSVRKAARGDGMAYV